MSQSARRLLLSNSKVFSKRLYHAPSHSNLIYVQHAHSIYTTPNTNANNNYHPNLLSYHSYTTPSAQDKDNKQKQKKKPLLNRFFRLFTVGPKIHYILEKSGAVVDHSLLNLISTSTALGIYGFIGVGIMNYFNVDTTPLIGLFGVGGAAIGFGMKDIANNYVCGIVMALQSLFKRGDEVTVANSFTGVVTRMNLRHLELETIQDGEKKIVFIPNSDVFSKPVIVHKQIVGAQSAMITEEEAEQQEGQ